MPLLGTHQKILSFMHNQQMQFPKLFRSGSVAVLAMISLVIASPTTTINGPAASDGAVAPAVLANFTTLINDPGASNQAEILANKINGELFEHDPDPPAVCNEVEGKPALVFSVHEGIRFLRKQGANNGDCGCDPHMCRRVSCSYDSAIFICNDNDFHIGISCATIADHAQHIKYDCADRGRKWVKGQYFDTHNWNVVVRRDRC